MSSETQFINRQKASWCVSKWWEAGDCSLYKWVQNMIKRNCRALRKSNVLTIITLTLAHSMVWSCSESVPIICELSGRLYTWYAFGVGLWNIWSFSLTAPSKSGASVCQGRFGRGITKHESWFGSASSCSPHGRDVYMLKLPWKPRLEGHKKAGGGQWAVFQRAAAAQASYGELFAYKQKRQRLNRRCPLFLQWSLTLPLLSL